MIIDTHAHYDDKRFSQDRHELLMSLQERQVDFVINSGADLEGCQDTLQMTKEYPFVYGTLGIHPTETGGMTEDTIEWLREHAKEEKIVAIGEMGLDYYWDKSDRETQKKWFLRQLELAKELSMPIVIHSRDAAKDTMEILKEKKAGENGGTIHCFSYSKEIACQCIELGFHIGIGGVITFKNAKKLKEAVEAIPIERILLETDCPYLSPDPHRGERNDSTKLIYVAEEIARLKGLTTKEVTTVTAKNAKDLYRIMICESSK